MNLQLQIMQEKRKLLSNLSQQLSRFVNILWCLYLSYLSHLIETLGTFNPPYEIEWSKKPPQSPRTTQNSTKGNNYSQ